MKRVVALLLVAVFVVLALASCGVSAKDLKGNKFEVSKVSVSLSKEDKKDLEDANIDVKKNIEDTKEFWGKMKFDFNEKTENVPVVGWSVDGKKVTYGVYEFELKSGKLVMETPNGSTIKLTLKKVK